MNDDLAGLEQILERATAPSDATQGDLDPDSKSLREAWLAFGRLLEAAQPPAAPSLEQLQPRPMPRRWPLAVAAALAASLFIALSVHWFWGSGGTPVSLLPTGNGIVSVKNVKTTAPAAAHKPAPAAAGDLQWDDSLDQQIANAGQEVTLAQSNLACAFDATDSLHYSLQQAQQDLENNKL